MDNAVGMTSEEAVYRNKVIWITGASSGIGEAIARRLSRIPCRIALTARRGELLDKLSQELSQLGAEVRGFPGDVCEQSEMHRVCSAIEEMWGGVHLLIANAGTHSPERADEFDSAECLKLMKINYGGVLHCIEAVLPGMLKRRTGHIVGVSSVAGYRGLPFSGAYVASKAAVTHFLESLRFELEPKGIDVTVVSPGFVRTPLTDQNDFPMPCLIEAGEAAEEIFRGVARRRKEVHFPARFTWMMKFLRIIPYPLYHFLVRKYAMERRNPG